MATTPDARRRRARLDFTALRRRAAGLGARLLARAERNIHWREQVLRDDENPIRVPTAAETRQRVHDYFARAVDLEDARDGHDDRSRTYEAVRAYDHHVLHPARDAWEQAAVDLIEALVLGGPPPRRWALQRWTRRFHHTRWYLREAAPWRAGHSTRRRPTPATDCGWDGTVVIGSSDPGGRWWPGWEDAPIAGSPRGSTWSDEDPF